MEPSSTPPIKAHLSGVAERKAQDLIAQGYRVVGYTMEHPEHRSAVMFDSAVRWLTDEQRHALMFVESSLATDWHQIADERAAEIVRLNAELEEDDQQRGQLFYILEQTANALKGKPEPMTAHSWHDLAGVAAALVAERDALLLQLATDVAPGWAMPDPCGVLDGVDVFTAAQVLAAYKAGWLHKPIEEQP